MDIALVAPEAIKIKGKLASFIVDPIDVKGKLAGDGILLLSPIAHSKLAPVEDSRIIMQGAGEYEISSIKISGIKSEEATVYYIGLDNMVVMVGNASALKGKEVIRDADIAIIHADGVIDTSMLASLNPRVVVFYGAQAEQAVKAIGKEVEPVNKYTVTRDKLPVEMEVVSLS
ncbi:MAG TPA: hypothetical protein VFQ63_02990 [Patescibacteria group bacterium]|nr:hypothetical protein [Patescibacteria group bacterium]